MASVNIFGGFLVTNRMLSMYKKKDAPTKKIRLTRLRGRPTISRLRSRTRPGNDPMSANVAALLYLAAGVLFILALRGLSSPATSRAAISSA